MSYRALCKSTEQNPAETIGLRPDFVQTLRLVVFAREQRQDRKTIVRYVRSSKIKNRKSPELFGSDDFRFVRRKKYISVRGMAFNGADNSSVLFFVVVGFVNEVNHKVGRYNYEIENVYGKDIIHMPGDNLSSDSGDIAGDDKQDEPQAHILSGFGFVVLVYRKGPRATKAY